jgi:hypothetical protein
MLDLSEAPESGSLGIRSEGDAIVVDRILGVHREVLMRFPESGIGV